MAVMQLREAINLTLHQEMERDPNVIVLGEDLVGGMGTAGGPEAIGGIWKTSVGLYDKFGAGRVIDTPISESAIIGAAAGAALAGKRPVAELMFADFIGVCLDQIWNQMAKFRYMFGGKTKCPAVIRIAYGAGRNAGPQHSQAAYAMMTAIPGLKIVIPSSPAEARGLLTTAIRDDDPVLFFEPKALYAAREEVSEEEYLIPFGHARTVREGSDVTIVTCGQLVAVAAEAADRLAQQGIGCDVLDLRTTSPIDEEAILDSVELTGRLVVLDENPPRCGLAADVVGLVAGQAFAALRAPPRMVTPPHTPVPFAVELERAYLPNADSVETAVMEVLAYRGNAPR
ncbi:alpha-ketoacid dehydrogenase subunit beta [Sphingosinicella ginsenosidimutans]|uniref:Alpha-ketoacid dehydrogenase subunit beta n=1 Tax=Allosphingosinicella ginsenosidimutans TaxID=1176539 RepID=A0A5C6TUB8_9SPHN|nr:alpha-ketoacid dehydrogenase subunit beta [Sphingosinicella ginsenosidimutans]TXC64033.1 alpha-ketoacid dehydrogenase subunit beta [Sphingosinicella ginsenosidimutans]